MERRDFIKQATAATAGLAILPHFLYGQEAPTGFVFDAMGEVRTIYTMDLVDKILASGTRAITVTLTDPKYYGHEAYDILLKDLAAYDKYFYDHPSHFIKATRLSDIDKAIKEKKLAVFYLIQGSEPIEKDLGRLDILYNLGLRSVQMTYNTRNYAGDGCYERTDAGLSNFGMELVARLNEKKMLIDLSHAGMKTMEDTIKASKKPVIISHSTCRALYPHARNTTDENMKLLADKGGVIGMCQIRTFMTKEKANNLEVYFDHIDHAVKTAGIDHVAIGSDRDHRVIPDTEEEIRILLEEEGAQFKPDDWPLYLEKLNGPSRMNVIRENLAKRKYSQSQIDKIMGGNLYRLYGEVVG
ncbi:MAG: dipeptidase [Cyclobacteriaceae bacterium]|nr:membrane dipeptidase [Cyclobacteriaceae bacterium]MCB0498104.1 membrane dipeptidase [Cyclobacteriaceae bacterium]MCB9238828.1 membrane dipeptidase [Flammeovirgaceae bacterium]MCO5270547.1 dipeptidase [Cyclobacteriaceae bacterium]MCW5901012.1 membrane dipeptidase [Cyclobacteriaceae bacterium]